MSKDAAKESPKESNHIHNVLKIDKMKTYVNLSNVAIIEVKDQSFATVITPDGSQRKVELSELVVVN